MCVRQRRRRAGTVTPDGRATTYHFEYGPTDAYGTSTPDTSAGAALTAADVAAAIDGLAAGTTYHYRLVATSPDGSAATADRTFTTAATTTGTGGTGGTGGIGDDRTAPVLSAFSATPRTFAVNRRGTPEVAVKAAKRGTRLSWRLSEPARIVFELARKSSGRKVGRRCVKPTRANTRRKRCTRYVLAGRFAVSAAAGAGRRAFSGRIGKRALAPGTYRVTAVARDAAGNVSRPQAISLRVVRR